MTHRLSIAYGLVVALAFTLANALPQAPFDDHGYRHGWPVVFMTREAETPGTVTVLNGPWPFFGSSLETFEPSYLGVNAAAGLALVVASILALWRILIREPAPVEPRISLWHSLCGITLFGVALTIFRNDLIFFLLFRLPILIIYWSLIVILLAMFDRRKISA